MNRIKAIIQMLVADVWGALKEADYAVLAIAFASGAVAASLLIWIL